MEGDEGRPVGQFFRNEGRGENKSNFGEHFPCFFKREGTIIMDARVAHEEKNIFEYVC